MSTENTNCSSSAARPYVCHIYGCDKSYILKAHLRRHEATHCGGFACSEDNCEMTFKSRETLKKHVDNIHLKKKPKKYKCDKCGEQFNKHNWLTRHLFKHTGLKPYQCSVDGCDARFLVPSKLKRHMKIHEGYTCKEKNCGKHFSKWTLFINHRRASHIRTYKCEFCDKEFRRLNNLKCHSEVHKSVEFRDVIMCHFPHCTRFYSKKSNLTQHIKSYHDKRPFVCSQENCHKAFKTKDQLGNHLALHLSRGKRKRKRKKSNPKPSFATRLAGLAPKKWQLDAIAQNKTITTTSESTKECDDLGKRKNKTSPSVKECKDLVTRKNRTSLKECLSKSKESRNNQESSSEEESPEKAELSADEEYQVLNVTVAKEMDCRTNLYESDISDYDPNDDIQLLLKAAEKMLLLYPENNMQKPNCISIKA